jgi:hypothetical protein
MTVPTHPVRDVSLVYVLVLALAALGRLSGLWAFDIAVATRPW